MRTLLAKLDKISELLEQINSITSNQTTVLLEKDVEYEDDNSIIAVLEEMYNYKEQLIGDVERAEADFEKVYEPYRGKITDDSFAQLIKEKVKAILDLKQLIVDNEKTNMMIMQSRGKQLKQTMAIPNNPKKVSEQYKNNRDIKIIENREYK